MAAALQEEMALVRQEAANAKAAQDRKKQAVAGRLLRDLIQDLKAIGITVDKKTGRVREEAAGEKPGKPPGGEAEEDAPDFDLFASDEEVSLDQSSNVVESLVAGEAVVGLL